MSEPADENGPSAAAEMTGGYALFAGLLGIVFLYLSLPMMIWFFGNEANPYGTTWNDGRPVAYHELQGGAMWRDIGTFGSGLLMLDHALLYGLTAIRPKIAKGTLLAVIVTSGLGIALNGAAAGMQIKAGFTSPLYALIGVILFALSLATAVRLLRSN
ncbi:MAG: hypothetical protein QM754_00875 [Tepidisphaeraceae bacterium]